MFENCDLIGPLIVASFGCSYWGNLFDSVDHILISSDPDVRVKNARTFQDCTFKKCKFYNVSFLVGEPHYEYVTSLGGANWITVAPKKDPVSLPPSPLDEPAKHE